MKIAILGTGMVGRAHATRLAELGYDVRLGTQDVDRTVARGDEPVPGAPFLAFVDALAGADLAVNALNGSVAVAALAALAESLAGVTLLDLSNPLGSPPDELLVANTDSLAEQIQRAVPAARVVKSLNVVTAEVQVDPGRVGDGQHDMFVAGDDSDAKALVSELLTAYGWTRVHDLGPLRAARGMEMLMPLWLSLMQSMNTWKFGYRIVS